jgi:hypothetical protein
LRGVEREPLNAVRVLVGQGGSSMKRGTRSAIMARETLGEVQRWNIQASNLNRWCRLPGSPFSEGFFLRPNRGQDEQVSVTFGPLELPDDVDTFTFVLVGQKKPQRCNNMDVEVSILGNCEECLARSRVRLYHGDKKALTLRFGRREQEEVHFKFCALYDDCFDACVDCGVTVAFIVGYKPNPLVDLFNRMGSDKGTEISHGEGTPHCYALEYYPLLREFSADEFNFLEIGLDTLSARNGHPKDAPSLKAWRAFFPKATIYGYDINDFGFFEQAATFTFQGDQSSRQDLARFLEMYGTPGFRVMLDDGSHASSHQQISLASLFPAVVPGGLYIIEDLFWQPFEETPKTLDVLQKFVETSKYDSPFVSEDEARYLEENIERIEIYKPTDSEFAVVYKKE